MKKNIPVIFFLAFALSAIVLIISGCSNSSTDSIPITPTLAGSNVMANVASTTAQSGGVIIYNGGSTVTENGVCWSSTDQTPTIADTKKADSVVQVDYLVNISGLSPATTYYLRAYATNANGTGYGAVEKFTTLASGTLQPYGTVTTFAGNLTGGYLDATGTAAQFNTPQGIAVDAQGNQYIADSYNNVIRKITPTGVVTTLAGSGTLGYKDGTGTAAQFYSPEGLTVDAAGNVYVADFGNNMIRKITSTGVVTTLAGNGYSGFADGTGGLAVFKSPRSITIDASGNLYVADQGNNIVRTITPAGVVTTLAGTLVGGYIDSTGINAAFRQPTGITIDAAGANLYVSDQNNHCIRKVNIATAVVTTLAGLPELKTVFGLPMGITMDTSGNIYFIDANGRLMELTKSNVLYTLAGTSGTYGFADGIGSGAQFNIPVGVSVYQGVLYVLDSNNNIIRKVTVK